MDGAEFRKVWLPLSENFYRVAYYILESESDARDAVQDLYVKLWNSRSALDGIVKPLSYGNMVLKNICMDRIRRASVRRAETLEESIPVESPDPPPDGKLSEKKTLKYIRQLIEELPEKQRIVMKLRVFEDMEYSEISKLTGLSELNLRVLLSTARKTLKNKLKDHEKTGRN